MMSNKELRTLLKFEGISKILEVGPATYNRVLKEVSFAVKKGEIFGFVGQNGAGKSTILKIAMGYLKPDSGEVFFYEGDNKILPKQFVLKGRCGFLAENFQAYDEMTVEEVVNFAVATKKAATELSENEILEVVDRIGIRDYFPKKMKQLSKGMRQKVGLTLAVMGNPEVLILDEPASGLDPLHRYEFKNLIKELNAKGVTVIFSSHLLEDVRDLCDRIAIVHGGEIVEVLDLSKLEGDLEEYFVKRIKKIYLSKAEEE